MVNVAPRRETFSQCGRVGPATVVPMLLVPAVVRAIDWMPDAAVVKIPDDTELFAVDPRIINPPREELLVLDMETTRAIRSASPVTGRL